MAAPVQATVEEFIKALRASEVRVSPAEAIDAHRALMEVGYARPHAACKDALCVTLAKSEDEVERFDECFDAFFTRDAFQGEAGAAAQPEPRPGEGGGDRADLPLARDAAARTTRSA